MPQRRYRDEEKKELIDEFLELRRNAGVSLRMFSNMKGIHYYTLRDWYRDQKYNRDYWEGKEAMLAGGTAAIERMNAHP